MVPKASTYDSVLNGASLLLSCNRRQVTLVNLTFSSQEFVEMKTMDFSFSTLFTAFPE